MGLITLVRNGIIFDVILGVAGLSSAAHIPIMSSLLTSIYAVPSTRRYCVFTFFLAGGNAFSVVFGGLGFGLVEAILDVGWRPSFVYIAILFSVVTVAGALIIPNMPRDHPPNPIPSHSEDRDGLLNQSREKTHGPVAD